MQLILDLDRLDRFTTGALENCFMPILQLLLVFPILLQHFSDNTSNTDKGDEDKGDKDKGDKDIVKRLL